MPSKSSAKSLVDPSHARSAIRRTTDRRRHLHEAREHRLRMLAALQARDQNNAHRARAPLQPPPVAEPSSRALESRRPSGRDTPRLDNFRISELRQHVSELSQHVEFGRRYLSQAANRLVQDLGINDLVDEFDYTQPPSPSAQMHPDDTIVRPASPEDTPSSLPARTRWRRENARDNAESRYHRRRHLEHMRHHMVLNSVAGHRHAQRMARYADGLGDRDRSLSPDTDGVWDTLQSTLTPDPQPPSLGSSFASTAVSATTQVNETGSASTSMTNPNEDTEPPCDPIIDDSGSDSEDDVGERPTGPEGEPTTYSRRSYAEVVADPWRQSEFPDAGDTEREWLLGMHRIVRRLASRSDIPDDWWSQAGLSRSMSWEDLD